MRLRIERTTSYQVENDNGYCATVYSRKDAELVRGLARTIPRLRCLKEHSIGKQPKGLYVYVKGEPLVETYDARLDRLVRKHAKELRGDV